MVDAKDLVLFENAEQRLIERARGRQIGAERLLDNDAAPGAVVLARQTGVAEVTTDRREACRRRRQIKEPISSGSALFLNAGQFLADLFVSCFVVRLALT
jgi:hypothetical protein